MTPVTYPLLAAGRARRADVDVRAWTVVAWLLAVEVRAYLEDLDGALEQPELERAVALRLVELLADADAQLLGCSSLAEGHALAHALEYGLQAIASITGEQLVEVLQVEVTLQSRGGPQRGVAAVRRLAERLIADFPGDLPDPLQPQGQGQILRALRGWSKLAEASGIDATYLEPLLKDA